MSHARRGKRKPNPYSKGQVNRLIDDLIHPFFDTNKGLILVDGVLHSLVEQNPSLSIKKFVKYDLPELMKQKRTNLRMPGTKRRSYNCELPVKGRYIFCSRRKAGSYCLRLGVGRTKCPKLIISYKQASL